MVNKQTLRTMVWLAVVIFPFIAAGQTITTNETLGSLKVSGTSTVHDWEMELTEFESSASLEENGDGSYELRDASFTSDANHLASEKSMMENKAHKALKAKDQPEISFRQNGDPVTIDPDQNTFDIKGDLKIAGKTTPVDITLTGEINGNQELQITGSKQLKMTDFDIDPPTVMLGSIKTDDKISVTLNLTLKN
ncbi:MAG: YceI family protein [Marinilabilia sp.]